MAEFNYLFFVLEQVEMSADFTDLKTQLEQAEKDLGQLNERQIQDRLQLLDVSMPLLYFFWFEFRNTLL